jgi:succinate dehydrogenase / fumarate reductase, cytochrome b subunit
VRPVGGIRHTSDSVTNRYDRARRGAGHAGRGPFPSVTGSSGGPLVTATQDARPLTPDITVKPVNRRARPAPFPLNLYQTAVGKKWVMALTGVGLMGFVLAHMVGNLKMYYGPEDFDAYAESLRSLLYPLVPKHSVLWVMRIGLIAMFALHLHSAYSLTIMNRRSRPMRYQSRRDYLAANFASRTMRWSGVLLLAFLLIHLANLTWGWFPGGVDHRPIMAPAYDNVVASLSQPWLAAIYIVGQLALAVHLFHGAWSLFQSLGINNPRYNAARKYFAAGFAILVAGANISFPIAVLAGIVGR